MTRLLRNVWLQRGLALLLGGVFVFASHDKIWWPERFARILYHYQVIGPSAVFPPLLPNLFAVSLPWVELVAGLALIFGFWRREASLLAGLLLAVFVAAVGFGALPGVLALGLHSVGMVGKFFAEAIEHVNIAPIEAVRATGAKPLQVIVPGIMPQAIS